MHRRNRDAMWVSTAADFRMWSDTGNETVGEMRRGPVACFVSPVQTSEPTESRQMLFVTLVPMLLKALLRSWA